MSWSFGSNNSPSKEQMAMFGQAANESGLTDMAMGQVNQLTGGMKNEDQVQMLYQLMALHPNEVALFFLEYPNFMTEFASLIGLIVRKELYDWFSSGVITPQSTPRRPQVLATRPSPRKISTPKSLKLSLLKRCNRKFTSLTCKP